MKRQIIPLSKRPGDIAILAFFLINILFITYIVDLEQLVIADPAHFTYPLWPPIRPALLYSIMIAEAPACANIFWISLTLRSVGIDVV